MDQAMPPRRQRRLLMAALAAAVLLSTAAALWQLGPRGLRVPIASARLAAVERGLFRDEVLLRATVAPLHSVVLDAVESGRVEEVLARDGAIVAKGELLFRLSNPQRRLDLLARESEHAQQISNITNLRVAAEASRSERARRLADLAFALALAGKQHQRNLALARDGFLSGAAMEDSADRMAQQRRVFDAAQSSNDKEEAIQDDALRQMERATGRLGAGLQLVNATIDALAVRAPVAGRLTDFRLQVGETVRPDQHLGRIDDQALFKLSAQVDEYYLSRIGPGRQGATSIDGHSHALVVSRIYPQIKDGRFALELAFERDPPPTLRPGQGAEVSITLGGARAGLLLPNDAFINDSGGLWVYVLDSAGAQAERRAIRSGRRSHSQVEVLAGLAEGERVLVSSYASYGASPTLHLTK